MHPRMRRQQHGFTLLEMAIVLMVVAGSVAIFSVQAQKASQPSSCYSTTQAKLVDIRSAITHYVHVNNRYPMPASRSVGMTSTIYGAEATGSLIDTIPNGGNPILFGALPFQALGLPASYATDCWGNQFSYVVTAYLTVTVNNTPALPPQGLLNPAALGGLTIKTGTFASPTTLLNNASYAVISHGQNGDGAVRPNNTGPHGWCTDDASLDHENCDLDATLFAAPFNNGANAGANYFDDLLIFESKTPKNCNAPVTPVTWSEGINSCAGTFNGPTANTTSQTVTATAGANTGSANFTCMAGTPIQNAIPAPSCAPVNLVNGACGSAQGHPYQYIPTTNLCSAGVASPLTETAAAFSWTCAGSGGGSTANCSAIPICRCGAVVLICINPRNPIGGLNVLGINILCP